MRTRNSALRDLVADEAQLARHGLPLWRTEDDVAEALGISLKQLRFFAIHRETALHSHYVSFTIPKQGEEAAFKKGVQDRVDQGTRFTKTQYRTIAVSGETASVALVCEVISNVFGDTANTCCTFSQSASSRLRTASIYRVSLGRYINAISVVPCSG